MTNNNNNNNDTIKTVVVFGSTGVIGTDLIQIISQNQPNWTIRAVSRSGPANTSSRLAQLHLPNVQPTKGSVQDLDNVQHLTKDADLVYCCVGFQQYERKYWADNWPIVVKNLLAVTSTDRPLIFCDNLYAYGAATNMNPNTTPLVEANSASKPGVRALVRQSLQKRMDEQPGSVVAVGGSDFFGPNVPNGKCVLGDTMFGKMVNGQQPVSLAPPDKIHDFCLSRDFANALYVVSTDENRGKSMGRFWICPHSIHNMTLTDIAVEVKKRLDGADVATGGTGVSFQVIPSWLFYLLGWFIPTFYELREMMPIWENEYSVDCSEFEETFGVVATPVGTALDETIAAFRKR